MWVYLDDTDMHGLLVEETANIMIIVCEFLMYLVTASTVNFSVTLYKKVIVAITHHRVI